MELQRPRQPTPRESRGAQGHVSWIRAAISSGFRLHLPRRLLSQVALGCYLALYAAWQLTGFGPLGEQPFISNIFFWPVDLVAVGACLQAARRAAETPRLARAWRLFAGAVAGQLVGDVIYTLYDLHGSAPFPSVADVFYLAFYPLVLAALLSIPKAPFVANRGRLTLDLAIVTLGGSTALVYLVLGPTALNDNGGLFPGVVAVVCDVDSLGAVFLQRGPVIVGEAVHAVACRHMPEPRAPERQRVDQRFAQDDFFRGYQRLFIPHAAMRAGKIQM